MRLAWSKLAKHDLVELRDFSIERCGNDVARRYLEDIRDAARNAAARPRRVRTLKGQLGVIRVRSHYLIVHTDAEAGRLTVARVLHMAMDIERHLP